jgi:mannose-1-phosphate guanylyltransferase
MESIPAKSIDYAVMEKSDRVAVVPCDIGWSDLGSFDSLYPVSLDPASGNSVLTETKPLFIDSRDNLVISRGDKKIVMIDVTDTSVIDTEDALLVVKRGSGQRVKEAVDVLKAESSSLLQAHTTVMRPWGSYTVLLDTDRVKVKRLVVMPGQRISLQKHKFRQEHWVCIDGKGVVTLDDTQIDFERTVEVQVPALAVHRLQCVGDDPLVVIETQIGTYFGEDDIIRLEDDYRRTGK